MSLIETPYGRKSPELLTRAMDALERQPELLAALEHAEYVLTMCGRGEEAKKARAAINTAKKGQS